MLKLFLIILLVLISSLVYAKSTAIIITGTNRIYIYEVDWLNYDGSVAVIQSSGKILILSEGTIPIK